MAPTRFIAEPGVQQVLISRQFDAPRELVFRAHVEPALLSQWLGPRAMTMTVDRFDPCDGGRWRYVHTDLDGTEYGFHGVFHGTPSLDGIVQTFEFEAAPGHISLQAMKFGDQNGKTVVTIQAVFQSIEDRDAMVQSGMEQGMTEGMDRLDELFARLQQATPR